VVETNELLANSPEKLNQDPHGDAWLIRLKVASPDEFNNLLSASDYQNYVGAES
jgi:glycine cleavage system H protein